MTSTVSEEYVTYGPNLMSLTGLVDLSGYPDAEPSSMGLVFPDYSNGILGAWLILGALAYRRRTGQSQYLDMSQYESLASLMQPAVLDYSANQRLATRQGNSHSVYVPHNCYPCRGEERYCVIAVQHESEWQGLCAAMGHPEWTRQHRAEEVMARLQAHGVRAGVVQHIADLTEHDPHLRARAFFKIVRHTLQGEVPISGLPWEYSGTPGSYHRAAPCLGEHNQYVYGELLGMSTQEIDDYTERGIFY